MIEAFVLPNNEADKPKEITTAVTMNNNSIIHAKDIQQELEDGSRHGDLSYIASKRKVPRGPDPIHNRFFTDFLFYSSLSINKSLGMLHVSVYMAELVIVINPMLI